jgi:hypothetical protein
MLTTIPQQQSRKQASTAPYKASTRSGRRPKAKQQQLVMVKSSRSRKNVPAKRNKISECGLMYASALADPANTPVGACIPFGFPIPSQKIKTFSRGTFALGTTGFGFAVAKPILANDSGNVLVTSSTSVGGSTTLLSAFTNTVANATTKLPFNTAQMADSQNPVAGRTVAMEIRVRYAGTEQGRNGIVSSLEEPDHRDLKGISPATFSSYTSSLNERPPPDGSWHSVKWSGPVSSSELNYVTTAYFLNLHPIGFSIQGVAGDLYEWEFYIHNEYTGTVVNGMTPSHADSDAYTKVVETYKSITSNSPLNNDSAPTAFSEFVSSAGSTLKGLVLDYGVPALAGLISPALVPFARMGTRMISGK